MWIDKVHYSAAEKCIGTISLFGSSSMFDIFRSISVVQQQSFACVFFILIASDLDH